LLKTEKPAGGGEKVSTMTVLEKPQTQSYPERIREARSDRKKVDLDVIQRKKKSQSSVTTQARGGRPLGIVPKKRVGEVETTKISFY